MAVEMLFKPGQIGSLTIKNRFVRSATAESMSRANGTITQDSRIYISISPAAALASYLQAISTSNRAAATSTTRLASTTMPGLRPTGSLPIASTKPAAPFLASSTMPEARVVIRW